MNQIIRRKLARDPLARARAAAAGGPDAAPLRDEGEGGRGADHAWRLALARALRDGLGLMVEVQDLRLSRAGLAEVLEMPPEKALIAMLDGPGAALGMLVFSPELTSSVIEMQTMGRVSPQAPPPRRPTRTDAAMVAGLIDRALVALDDALAEEADLVWAGGFRYASFLEEARPLGLLLEDAQYRVITLTVLARPGAGPAAGPGRGGTASLVLPAEGRGRRPAAGPAASQVPGNGRIQPPAFTAALAEAIMAGETRLDAVLARFSLPIAEVMGFAVGQTLVLPGDAALDRITFCGIDGRVCARGRLGRQKGMRALRLSEIGDKPSETATPAPVPQRAAPPALPELSDPPLTGGNLSADFAGAGLAATG